MFPRRVLSARVFRCLWTSAARMPFGPANVHRTPGRLWQRDHAKRGDASAGPPAPFGAKHRLDQRMNKGVPAGGDGWDAREAPPGMATGLAKRAGAALPPGSKTHIRHQYSRVLFAISFGSRKRVVSVASTGMPPGGSVIGQSASLPRENARRVFSRSLEGNLSTRDFGNISNPRGVW